MVQNTFPFPNEQHITQPQVRFYRTGSESSSFNLLKLSQKWVKRIEVTWEVELTPKATCNWQAY